MNWERGFKRVWYFLLGAIAIIWLGAAFAFGGPFGLGEQVVWFLLFTLCWQLVGMALLWVARGFRRDEKQPSTR